MANNERIYSIKLNGITESVDLVDKLLKKLEDLEKRINALQGKSVSVGSSGGGGGSSKSRTSDLTAEEKVSKKIQQTAEKIAQARTEEYKALQQAKSDLKEIERQQKAVAAAENLSGENAKQYANTLDGMRLKLADMKRALGGIDISSPNFNKQVQEIDALNSKIKEIEQSYGVFGRNVGNYANGVAEGLTKVTIKVGETERTFNSAKEASKTLGNELKSMAVNGEQGTKAYSDLDEAFKKLQSTMKDVSASSQKMDMLLDTMKGFTALGSVGQGLSSLFGFDGGQIQESIQKLVALQNVMQGLETIQKQMTTEEGLGAIFKDMSASVDVLVAKLPGVKLGLNGLEASSKTATVAVKGLSTAMKALSGLALAWALDKAIDQLKDIGSEFKSLWGDITGGEKFTQQEQLANAIENVNRKLENRLQLINEDKSLSEWGKQTEVINEVNKALKEQIGLYTELNKEGGSFWEKMQQYAGQGIDDVISGKGLLKTFGSMTKDIAQGIANFAAARKSNEELEASVGSLANSAKVASKQISADANEMVQRWVKEIDKCDLKTEEGRKKFQELAKALDDDSVLNSVLLNLDRYFRSPETRAEIESIIAKIKQLRGELSAPLGSFTSNVSNYMKNGVKWMQKFIEDHRKKQTSDSVGAVKSTGAKVGETIQQQEQELTRLRIRAMDEGLQKVIAEINYNARKEIDALKLTGTRKAEAEALIEQERQRKIFNAQKEYHQKMLEERKKYEDKIAEMTASNEKREIENNINDYENGLNSIKYIPYEAAERENERGELVKYFDEIFFLNPDNVDEFLKKNYDEIASVLKDNEDFKKLYNEIGLSYDNLLEFVLQKRIQNIKKLYVSEQNIIESLYKQKKDELNFDFNTAQEELEKEMKSLLGTSTQNSILANVTKDFRVIPSKEKLDKAEQEYKEFIAGIKKQISSLSENDTKLFEKLSLQLGGSLGEAYDKGEIGFKEMLERLNAYYEQFKKRSTVELNDYANKVFKLDLIDNKSSVVSTRVNYYNNLIKEIERQLNATQNRYGQGQERDAFGIIDLAKTKKLSNETKLTYDNLLKELDNILENAFKADLPNDEFQNLQTTLETLIRKIKELKNEVNNKSQNIFGDFLQSIMPYVSQLANGLQSILSQVSSLISAEFDSQRQALDDELALLEENYNAQEELLQRHSDKINAIEDEIANARGARRDRLVDMYNEEIEQQRRAYQEKQKIDEEMRRNEEKQKALEKAERKKQDEIQFQQALMSQSLAIMNAFATKPFVPVGLAMGALATTLSAVQIALMKKAMAASEKYSSGGIVSGNSHAQGGVKAVVGGQRAVELEGNEFIIRKKTATQNLPLLDYINKSERKLNANDLLEFFKGNQGTKSIKNNFKTQYASGGALPSVSTTKTNNIVIVKDESHPVVSVVDIINATDNYQSVRVLAGVDE